MSLMMKMSGKPTGQDKEMEYSKVQDDQHRLRIMLPLEV